MVGTSKNTFNSLDELIDFHVEQLSSLHAEIREIKIAILNLKHQDKLSFNIKEASEVTGYGQDTLYSYIRQGLIPVTQVTRGSRFAIRREDLIDFLVSKRADFLALRKQSPKTKRK